MVISEARRGDGVCGRLEPMAQSKVPPNWCLVRRGPQKGLIFNLSGETGNLYTDFEEEHCIDQTDLCNALKTSMYKVLLETCQQDLLGRGDSEYDWPKPKRTSLPIWASAKLCCWALLAQGREDQRDGRQEGGQEKVPDMADMVGLETHTQRMLEGMECLKLIHVWWKGH